MLAGALTKLLDSAAGAAGTQAWAALKGIIAKHRGGGDQGEPTTPQEVSELAEKLAVAAAADPKLAQELAAWHQATTGSGDTTSSISGTVHGNVVQARDVSGSINFG